METMLKKEDEIPFTMGGDSFGSFFQGGNHPFQFMFPGMRGGVRMGR